MKSLCQRNRQRGFTLLEMMVALVIVAVALGAIIVNGGNAAGSATAMHERTLALWVAHNRLSELDLAPVWPAVGKSNDDVSMGGIEWTWNVTVQTTPDPSLRRIDIDVQKKGRPKDGRFAFLTGFIANTGRQTTQ